jgi:predicted dehydrogenase
MSNNKKIRLGIIGLGKMGKSHLNILSFLNSAEVVFVSDLDVKKYNNNKFFFTKNPFSLLKEVDAVIIATPTFTHFDIIKKLGKKVKNIFVEKPLAQNFSEVKKIINFAKKNKINLRVGFIERFNPAVQSLLKIIKKNQRIISFDFTRTSPLSSRIKDVDVVIDLMVHDVDLAILFNGNVKFVKSYGYKKFGKIFYVTAVLQHENGVFSRILTSRITQKKIRLINVVIENKYIECDLLRKELYISKNTKVKDYSKKNFTYKNFGEVIETSHQEALLSELQAFINSCRGLNNKYLANHQHSYEVMRVCEKIQKEIRLVTKR